MGIKQDGNVGEKIQNTGNVVITEAEATPGLEQRPDQLADAHAAAGVQPQRDDEVVQGKRRDEFTQNAGRHPEPRMVHGGIEHPDPLLSRSYFDVASAIVGPLYSPAAETARVCRTFPHRL